MKKALPILILIIFFTFFAYHKIDNSKINFLALGDGIALGENEKGKIGKSYNDFIYEKLNKKNKIKFYTKDFCHKDLRIKDFQNQIEDNDSIIVNNKTISINQAIHNANVITLSLGSSDLFYSLKINNSYLKEKDKNKINIVINNLFNDLDKTISLIRNNYDKKLIVLGFYNPLVNENYINNEFYKNVFNICNKKFKKLSNKYDLIYINTDDIINSSNKYLKNNNSIHINELGNKKIATKIIENIHFDKQ